MTVPWRAPQDRGAAGMPESDARTSVWAPALTARPFGGGSAGTVPLPVDPVSPVREPDAGAVGGPGVDVARDAALAGLTDLLASSLAGRDHPDVARLRGTLTPVGSGVAVPGQPGGFAPADAALLGGFQAHVLDLDDAHADVRGHPSAVLLPALLALADDATPGEEFLAAYVVGVEVMARLGRLAGRAHHAAGWHPTGTLGGIAAAVAGARLLAGSDGRETGVPAGAVSPLGTAGAARPLGTAGAVTGVPAGAAGPAGTAGAAGAAGTAGAAGAAGTAGAAGPAGTAGAVTGDAAAFDAAALAETAASLAASTAAGTRAQFGSAAKPLHAGLAAAAGVRAVTWARAGLAGNPNALFAPDGPARAMSFDVTDPAEAAEGLTLGWGRRWAIVDPGLWVKRYPFCSAGMAVHEAAETVEARLGPAARFGTGDGTRPRTGAAGSGEHAGGQPAAAGTPLRATDVRDVRALVRPGADAALRHRVPVTGAEGRFSLDYLVALGVLGRAPVNARFVDLDPEAVALAGRVVRAYAGDPSREPWARVEVTTADGAELTAQVGEPLGSPGRPLTGAQRRAKLEEAVGRERARHIEAAVTALRGGTVGDLRRALAATEEETP